jgi:tocopherol O-methyltransferase
MHHGYYGPEGTLKKDRRQAQIDLIEELLSWATSPSTRQFSQILDVGCGIGGSTLYLADKFRAKATGITLSPVQAQRATERAQNANLGSQVNFYVANALEMPFEDNSFDCVWTLESGEHMPDKVQFLQECYRVLQPGGTLIMATWCHRSTDNHTRPLTESERQHLAKIYRVYALPYVISLPEYETIATNLGFQDLRTADWSTAVAPFWDIVIDSAFTPKAMMGFINQWLANHSRCFIPWVNESRLSTGINSLWLTAGNERLAMIIALRAVGTDNRACPQGRRGNSGSGQSKAYSARFLGSIALTAITVGTLNQLLEAQVRTVRG